MDFTYRFAHHSAFNSLISAAIRWRNQCLACMHLMQPFNERLGLSLAHEELEAGVSGGSCRTGEAPGSHGGVTTGVAVRWRIQRSAAHEADRSPAARASRHAPTPDTAPRRGPAPQAHARLSAARLRQDDPPQRLAGAGAAAHSLATLDEDDDDPIRFWTYAVAALDRAYPGATGSTSACCAPRSLPRYTAS